MTVLVIGGSGSGKSAYAEAYICSLAGEKKKYYIAAMQACDAESEKRIQRHRMLRDGKGFSTIEQPQNIQKAAEKMEEGDRTALLECISNLTANEMFAKEMPEAEEAVAERVVSGVILLSRELTHLVIVSNNVFEDGQVYDRSTMAYIRSMGRINEKLAKLADEVIEVVAGIPVAVKKKERGFSCGCTF